MKFHALSAAVLLALAGQAGATTSWDLGAYTVTYDETTPGFGWLAGAFSSSGNVVGFNWNVQPAVTVSTGNGTVTASFDLPSFTITANPGYVLSGPVTGFLGNITYTDFNQGTTSITAGASVSVDGGPAVVVSQTALDKISTSPTAGYFVGSVTQALGSFNTFSLSAGSMVLTASAPLGSFATIIGQPQNQLRFSFQAAPVPEPETYALLLAGLGVVGWMARRRQR